MFRIPGSFSIPPADWLLKILPAFDWLLPADVWFPPVAAPASPAALLFNWLVLFFCYSERSRLTSIIAK